MKIFVSYSYPLGTLLFIVLRRCETLCEDLDECIETNRFYLEGNEQATRDEKNDDQRSKSTINHSIQADIRYLT
jgi:hypothetical protein